MSEKGLQSLCITLGVMSYLLVCFNLAILGGDILNPSRAITATRPPLQI